MELAHANLPTARTSVDACVHAVTRPPLPQPGFERPKAVGDPCSLEEHREDVGQAVRKPIAKPEWDPGKRGRVRKKHKIPFLDSLWCKAGVEGNTGRLLEAGATMQFLFLVDSVSWFGLPRRAESVREKLGKGSLGDEVS